MAYQMGIDLGTTYSSVAVAQAGRVEVLGLGNRSSAVPSVVLVQEHGEVLVGDAAEAAASREPTRVARQFKRRLGDPTPLFLGGVPYSAEALSGLLLRNLVERAVARMGEAPSHVVITHPAVYSNYKLDLLRDAARQAGLATAVLVPEPSAAALEYAAIARVEPGEVIGVYDFGGGTFDAALVRRTASGFELLGEPQGLERLGGVDFDEAVLEHVRDHLGDRAEIDVDDPATLAALARLRADSRQAKELLSEAETTEIPVIVPGLTTSVAITRDELERMVRPRLAEPLAALRRAIDTAGLTLADVSRIVLVGGSSRMPVVRRELERALGRNVSVDADPEAFVARGAARYAALLAAPAVPPPPVPPPPSPSPSPTEVMPVIAAPVGPFVPAAPGPRRSRRAWWIAAAVAVVAVVGVVAAVLLAGGDDDGTTSTTEASVTVAPTEATVPPTAAPTSAAAPTTTVAPTTAAITTTAAPATTAASTAAPTTAAPTTAAPTTAPPAAPTSTVVGVAPGVAPPPMPTSVQGFARDGDLVEQRLGVFGGGDAFLIDGFPVTMNGCDSQFFTVRWTAVDPSGQIVVGNGDITTISGSTPIADLPSDAPASGGYWSGDSCAQPAFAFAADTVQSINQINVQYQVWTPTVG